MRQAENYESVAMVTNIGISSRRHKVNSEQVEETIYPDACRRLQIYHLMINWSVSRKSCFISYVNERRRPIGMHDRAV